MERDSGADLNVARPMFPTRSSGREQPVSLERSSWSTAELRHAWRIQESAESAVMAARAGSSVLVEAFI
jgi:hypothetical protein